MTHPSGLAEKIQTVEGEIGDVKEALVAHALGEKPKGYLEDFSKDDLKTSLAQLREEKNILLRQQEAAQARAAGADLPLAPTRASSASRIICSEMPARHPVDSVCYACSGTGALWRSAVYSSSCGLPGPVLVLSLCARGERARTPRVKGISLAA